MPRESIILTMILFIILEFVYTTIGFLFFREDYNNNCNDLLYCLLFTYDYTFKKPGGVGTYLTENDKIS